MNIQNVLSFLIISVMCFMLLYLTLSKLLGLLRIDIPKATYDSHISNNRTVDNDDAISLKTYTRRRIITQDIPPSSTGKSGTKSIKDMDSDDLYNSITRNITDALQYPPSFQSHQHKDLLVDYCTNENTISYVQKHLYRHARLEVFGNDKVTVPWYHSNIYFHHFGGAEVEIYNPFKMHLKTLFYYQILRNGNTNILQHLARFAALYKNLQGCNGDIDCSRYKEYSRKQIESDLHDNIPTSSSKRIKEERFPFTFIRNPIDRFISAYTEIEYNIKKANKEHSPIVPLYDMIGTKKRLQDFVMLLLSANGSEEYLTEIGIDVGPLAPQIGTLLFATIKEHEYINLYHLESFEESFKYLVKDSKTKKLLDVFSKDQLHPHASSSDPYGTTKAAKKLFLLDDNKPTTDDDVRISGVYMRAICRMYIADYACLGLELPPQCSKVQDELIELLLHHNNLMQHVHHTSGYYILDTLIRLPSSILHVIADTVCMFSSSPDCKASIIHRSADFEFEFDRDIDEL